MTTCPSTLALAIGLLTSGVCHAPPPTSTDGTDPVEANASAPSTANPEAVREALIDMRRSLAREGTASCVRYEALGWMVVSEAGTSGIGDAAIAASPDRTQPRPAPHHASPRHTETAAPICSAGKSN